jgi:hypothetical protein
MAAPSAWLKNAGAPPERLIDAPPALTTRRRERSTQLIRDQTRIPSRRGVLHTLQGRSPQGRENIETSLVARPALGANSGDRLQVPLPPTTATSPVRLTRTTRLPAVSATYTSPAAPMASDMKGSMRWLVLRSRRTRGRVSAGPVPDTVSPMNTSLQAATRTAP